MEQKETTERRIDISEANVNDVGGICYVQKEGWLSTYVNEEAGITKEDILSKDFDSPKRRERWRTMIAENKPKMWVARDDGSVVAFLSVEVGKDKNKITAIYVLPDYQGMGIGHRLMDEAFKYLGDTKQISLEVVSYNEPAISFYEKLGFERNGQVKGECQLPSGKEIPEVEMVKPSKSPNTKN